MQRSCSPRGVMQPERTSIGADRSPRKGPAMTVATTSQHFLEPAAQEFADATSTPPFLYELGPEGARKVLDDVQAAPIPKLDVADKWITVPAEVGDVQVR